MHKKGIATMLAIVLAQGPTVMGQDIGNKTTERRIELERILQETERIARIEAHARYVLNTAEEDQLISAEERMEFQRQLTLLPTGYTTKLPNDLVQRVQQVRVALQDSINKYDNLLLREVRTLTAAYVKIGQDMQMMAVHQKTAQRFEHSLQGLVQAAKQRNLKLPQQLQMALKEIEQLRRTLATDLNEAQLANYKAQFQQTEEKFISLQSDYKSFQTELRTIVDGAHMLSGQAANEFYTLLKNKSYLRVEERSIWKNKGSAAGAGVLMYGGLAIAVIGPLTNNRKRGNLTVGVVMLFGGVGTALAGGALVPKEKHIGNFTRTYHVHPYEGKQQIVKDEVPSWFAETEHIRKILDYQVKITVKEIEPYTRQR